MRKAAVGFYKQGGKVRPITGSRGSRSTRARMSKPTKAKGIVKKEDLRRHTNDAIDIGKDLGARVIEKQLGLS